MFKEFISKYLINLFVGGIGIAIFGGWIIALLPEWLIVIAIAILFIGLLVGSGYYAYTDLISSVKVEASQKVEQAKSEANNIIEQAKSELEEKNILLEASSTELAILKKTVLEKNSGFPTLLSYIEAYERLVDDHISGDLIQKKNPAYKASEVVKEEARRRREAEKMYRQSQAVIDYYLSVAPFLAEMEEELPTIEDEVCFSEYSEEEAEDMVTRYVKKEEYRNLSTVDRNQLALDRYWSSRRRSKWLIGKMYERYVGFLYEKKGFQVEYFGINKRYDDLGRDLIARKGKEVHIIQCKNWSKFKTIYENHIFQLFGTTFEYSKRYNIKAQAIFYTTTSLSDTAREMCKVLNIKLLEHFPLEQYPSIKCNISKKSGEKIYHLPFDQQYDCTTIETEKLETYAMTVKEAEDLGFRRAFRWRGNRNGNS